MSNNLGFKGIKATKSNIAIKPSVSNTSLVPLDTKSEERNDLDRSSIYEDNTGQTLKDDNIGDYIDEPKSNIKIEVRNIIEIIIVILALMLFINEKLKPIPKVQNKPEPFKPAEYGEKFEKYKEEMKKYDELMKKYNDSIKKLSEVNSFDSEQKSNIYRYKKHLYNKSWF